MLYPHNSVVVKLPFLKKLWIFKFDKFKEVGFIFNNDAFLMFLTDHELIDKTNKDLEEWVKLHSKEVFYFEQFYYAALAYCKETYKKPFFTKDQFRYAFINGGKELQKVVDSYNRSNTFGSPKKKVVEADK